VRNEVKQCGLIKENGRAIFFYKYRHSATTNHPLPTTNNWLNNAMLLTGVVFLQTQDKLPGYATHCVADETSVATAAAI
jgi:hypothetical protein